MQGFFSQFELTKNYLPNFISWAFMAFSWFPPILPTVGNLISIQNANVDNGNNPISQLTATPFFFLRCHDWKGFSVRLRRILWQVLCNLHKKIPNIVRVFSGCFQMKYSIFLCVCVCLFEFHFTPWLKIGLVPSLKKIKMWAVDFQKRILHHNLDRQVRRDKEAQGNVPRQWQH